MISRYRFWRRKLPLTSKFLRTMSKPVVDSLLENRISSLLRMHLESSPTTTAGLSACQIGFPYRVFGVKDVNGGKVELFINPTITFSDNNLHPSKEGCLSLPRMYRTVSRQYSVDVETKYFRRTYSGHKSFVIQHEMDHLNGILLC